jgi:CDP-glucose 4,6-dehydratase
METLPSGAYRGVRVLVTGHTGFKGAWLCEWLAGEGAIVAGLALAPETPSLFADLRLAERITSMLGDIRELATVEKSMRDFAPDVVFHLAAQAIVRAAYADPIGNFATNIMGTAHVLDAARRCPSVKAIVCVTSDKCYENREWVWGYRESDPLGGRDPYSASKAAAEIVAGSYREAVFPLEGRIRLATARAGNVIGGGDWSADRLVPDIARAIAAKERLVLRNPQALRPWQHVLEPIRGYLALGHGLLSGAPVEGAWNFGPGRENEITVADMAHRFMRVMGAEEPIRLEPSPLPEAQALRLEISKAQAELGWRPKFGIAQTIEMTAEWYRARADGGPDRAAAVARSQIAAYKKEAVAALKARRSARPAETRTASE